MIAGCDENESQVSERQGRLYVVQNAELKKQIEDSAKDHATELAQIQKQLDECKKQNEQLSSAMEKDAIKLFEDEAFTSMAEELQELTTENAELKAKIVELESQSQ